MRLKPHRMLLWMVLFMLLVSGCGVLRSARIRKDVTLNSYRDQDFRIEPRSLIAVIPVFHKEEGISGISFSVHEAAAEVMSVRLWNAGFCIIDKVFIKEILLKERIEFRNFSVSQAAQVADGLGADYVMLISLTELEEDTRSVDFGPFNVINTVDTSVLVGLNCRLVNGASKRVVWTGVATTQDKNLQLCLRRISGQLISTLQNGTPNPREHRIPLLGVHF